MGLQPRVDPLIIELVNGASHDEQDIRDSMVNALSMVTISGGQNSGSAARQMIAELVQNTLQEPGKDYFNAAIARTLAAMLTHDMSQAEPLLASILEGKATPLSSMTILECVERAPEQLYQTGSSKVVSRILRNVINEHPGIARPAREARDLLKKTAPWSADDDVQVRLA